MDDFFLVNNRSHDTVTAIRTVFSALGRFRLGRFGLFLGGSMRPNFVRPSDTSVCWSLARSQGVSVYVFSWVDLALFRGLLLDSQVAYRWENTIYGIWHYAVL